MADEEKSPPLKVLKQMSIKRQDLERSTENLTTDLEQLQLINEEQEHRINLSLGQLQKEQQMAQQILQPAGGHTTKKPSAMKKLDLSESSFDAGVKGSAELSSTKEIRQWTTADVIRWLEQKQLHRFILLFHKNHVSGQDLADTKLGFLENCDHISTEEREHLLSEVYALLYPDIPEADNIDKITSPLEREKYLAAVQLAKAKGAEVTRSSSVILLPSHNFSIPGLSSSSMQSLRLAKERRTSESGAEGTASSPSQVPIKEIRRGMMASSTPIKSDAADTSSQSSRSGHHKKDIEDTCLYSTLQCIDQQQVQCVGLDRHGAGFGVGFRIDQQYGHVMVEHVTADLYNIVHVGDRVLEINGLLLTVPVSNVKDELSKMVETADSLHLVLSRTAPHSERNGKTRSGNNGVSDWRWDKLQAMLLRMQDSEVNVDSLVNNLPPEQVKEMKDKYAMKDEIEHLKKSLEAETAKVTEQTAKLTDLQKSVESQKAALTEAQNQRDDAVEKLALIKHGLRIDSEHAKEGVSEYYRVAMESLKLDKANKKEIVEALKDIVREASRQKWYLDRLISVVIDEAPWLLDQVDADFDDSVLQGQPEEFC